MKTVFPNNQIIYGSFNPYISNGIDLSLKPLNFFWKFCDICSTGYWESWNMYLFFRFIEIEWVLYISVYWNKFQKSICKKWFVMRYNRGKILFGFHDLMVFSFRLTVILTLFCFGCCKCSFLVNLSLIHIWRCRRS